MRSSGNKVVLTLTFNRRQPLNFLLNSKKEAEKLLETIAVKFWYHCNPSRRMSNRSKDVKDNFFGYLSGNKYVITPCTVVTKTNRSKVDKDIKKVLSNT